MVQLSTRQQNSSPGLGARGIYDSLRQQIVAGVYGHDGVLPSARALAVELGVSRTTVTSSYEQLAAEGFVVIRHGARPRVAIKIADGKTGEALHEAGEPHSLSAFGERLRSRAIPMRVPSERLVADFRYGDMSASDFPTLAWRNAMNDAALRRPPKLFYDDPRGSIRLRAALQGYLWRARSIRCEVDEIVIVNGSQQGLDLCARLLLDAGDRFVIEDPCYPMARSIFEMTGAMAAPVDVDVEGIRADLLADVDARLAYVTPSHQFPMGSVMSIGRRQQLLRWAEEKSAYIVEDDYDSEYRFDMNPVPPLRALGGASNVIYVGTVSKTLSPTLRIGYVVVPRELQEVFAHAKRLTDRHAPILAQEALATLLESGVYESHVRKARRHNARRRAALLDALQVEFQDAVGIEGAEAGLHVVAWFLDLSPSMATSFIERSYHLGVGIYSITPHYFGQGLDLKCLGLVMGYAGLTEQQIDRGVKLLRNAYDGVL
ncbi:PLP-dependent aminotransferase family protein [Neorhizobium galegae]|uniref:Transcriptional regulator, GntR family with aminotransferase domain n=1 Tax=Neorhizobium galegae bv. orientalis str. HAMBI 540 TaxID=1028800 RepID=A0A068T0D3_NEOGA|nr:PLP-dependent aminotransferase family protein [Neorhizobium galegae]MCQ1854462.1 PLP-dependent aminotransferase family protein [Neorhizobium galegae]CDN51574.1 Transcriptional regulator, GntR family with aminotransferase domain [Neorhizobium galegae bv. orientalis str. HAMBI 540]CDZ54662.1 Transcriptional regulator, GntR family with aminotransferase domain [Neorhizobium galegae bv. orientalis]